MTTCTMYPFSILACMLVFASSAPAEWRLSAGLSYHAGMELRANEPASYAGTADLAPFLPGPTETRISIGTTGDAPGRAGSPAGRDDITQVRDRQFDNGHVGPDRWTADSGVPPDRLNLTWNWSAASPSQYDPASQTLTFTRTTTRESRRMVKQTRNSGSVQVEYQSLENSPLTTAEDLNGAAADFMADWVSPRKGRWQAGARLGLSLFLPEERQWDTGDAYRGVLRETTTRITEETLTQTTSESQITETYVYADPYNVVPAAGLPYDGPSDPVNGPGPLISALPQSYSSSQSGGDTLTTTTSSRSRNVSVRNWQIDSIAYEVELNQQRLWINPRLDFTISPSWTLQVGPVLSLTFAEMEASRQAQLSLVDSRGRSSLIHTWNDHDDDQAVLPGGGVSAGINWAITPSWFMAAAYGANWIKTTEIQTGPATIEMDLSGWQGSLQIGRIF